MRVIGRVVGIDDFVRVGWIAAAGIPRRFSFPGSGFVHPSRELAIAATPNRGIIQGTDGGFDFELAEMPAGYYTGLGSTYVPPHVEIVATRASGDFFRGIVWLPQTSAPTKYRWLAGDTSPDVTNPVEGTRDVYYSGQPVSKQVLTQEEILKASAYKK